MHIYTDLIVIYQLIFNAISKFRKRKDTFPKITKLTNYIRFKRYNPFKNNRKTKFDSIKPLDLKEPLKRFEKIQSQKILKLRRKSSTFWKHISFQYITIPAYLFTDNKFIKRYHYKIKNLRDIFITYLSYGITEKIALIIFYLSVSLIGILLAIRTILLFSRLNFVTAVYITLVTLIASFLVYRHFIKIIIPHYDILVKNSHYFLPTKKISAERFKRRMQEIFKVKKKQTFIELENAKFKSSNYQSIPRRAFNSKIFSWEQISLVKNPISGKIYSIDPISMLISLFSKSTQDDITNSFIYNIRYHYRSADPGGILFEVVPLLLRNNLVLSLRETCLPFFIEWQWQFLIFCNHAFDPAFVFLIKKFRIWRKKKYKSFYNLYRKRLMPEIKNGSLVPDKMLNLPEVTGDDEEEAVEIIADEDVLDPEGMGDDMPKLDKKIYSNDEQLLTNMEINLLYKTHHFLGTSTGGAGLGYIAALMCNIGLSLFLYLYILANFYHLVCTFSSQYPYLLNLNGLMNLTFAFSPSMYTSEIQYMEVNFIENLIDYFVINSNFLDPEQKINLRNRYDYLRSIYPIFELKRDYYYDWYLNEVFPDPKKKKKRKKKFKSRKNFLNKLYIKIRDRINLFINLVFKYITSKQRESNSYN